MMHQQLAFVFALYAAALSGVHAQTDVRINFGSKTDWKDGSGKTWLADTFLIGKASSSSCAGDPIAGTTIDTIYCKNRFFTPESSNYGPYKLNIPMAQPGQYLVRLHFAELVSYMVLM